jgi:hypothetical protein
LPVFAVAGCIFLSISRDYAYHFLRVGFRFRFGLASGLVRDSFVIPSGLLRETFEAARRNLEGVSNKSRRRPEANPKPHRSGVEEMIFLQKK